jgi:hypothetical protein
MRNHERVRLLFGPYTPPRLIKGDKVFCHFRDKLVSIIGWSDGRISWPRCCPVGDRGGGKGLLVDDELLRAVRHESATAVAYWWGVSESTAQRWRRAFDVRRMENEGTRRLMLANVEEVVLRHRPPASATVLWTEDEIALLGVLRDQEVVKTTGRSLYAVRLKRESLGIKNPSPYGGRFGGPPWTPAQDKLVLTLAAAEAAKRTGHTKGAVHTRRYQLRHRKLGKKA